MDLLRVCGMSTARLPLISTIWAHPAHLRRVLVMKDGRISSVERGGIFLPPLRTHQKFGGPGRGIYAQFTNRPKGVYVIRAAAK
jgi:hypothetical protein